MSHKIYLMSLLILTVIFSGCRHHDMPDVEDLSQRLQTNITDSGIKQFEFTVKRIREPGMEGRHSRERFDNGRKKVKNPAERNRDLKEFAHSLLNTKISETGYCTSGYVLYDDLLSVGNYLARGECKEGFGEESFPLNKAKSR